MSAAKHQQASSRSFKEVKEQIKAVDQVLELLDARAPMASRNPYLKNLIRDKGHITVLNKADLADEQVTKSWLQHFKSQDQQTLAVGKNTPLKAINAALKKYSPPPKRFNKPRRIMVIGVPNVGKSTVINTLLKKKMARTGDRSGITRGRQWIRVLPELELLDTPGVLAPFLDDNNYLTLAVLGTLPEQQFDVLEAAARLLNYFWERGKFQQIQNRYEITIQDSPAEPLAIIDDICRQRGLFVKGGETDQYRGAHVLLKEFREGKLGRISLETPADAENAGEDGDDGEAGAEQPEQH